jgi:xylulokinase
VFPRLVESGVALGTILPGIQQQTGLPENIVIASAGHDHFCGSLACGILGKNCIVDSSGTAESIHGISAQAKNPFGKFSGFRVGRYLDSSYLYVVGGITSSGIVYEWAAKSFFTGISLDALDEILLKSDLNPAAIAELPMFLPHFRGSGAPLLDSNSRGAFFGLNEKTDFTQLMFAVVEGLAMESAKVIQQVEKTLPDSIDSVIVTGGGSKNRCWQQWKANVLNKPVEITVLSETTSLGAAMLAVLACGAYDSLAEVSSALGGAKIVLQPQKELTEIFRRRFEIYQQIYSQSIPIHSELLQLKKNVGN